MTSKGIDDAYKKVLGKKGFSVIDPDSRYEVGDEPTEVEKYTDGMHKETFKRKAWRDDVGRLHRESGPALILIDYEIVWDADLPDKEDLVLTKIYGWYKHGKLHNINGPAKLNVRDNITTRSEWYLNGKLHRENGPAVFKKDYKYGDFKYNDETEIYEFWKYGVLQSFVHIGRRWGTTHYDNNNNKHRDNGPAEISISPYTSTVTFNWYKHGKLHRTNGPAVVRKNKNTPEINGTGYFSSQYWINGVQYTKEEYEKYFKDTSEGDKDILADLGQSFD
jgi:hypothetical protein